MLAMRPHPPYFLNSSTRVVDGTNNNNNNNNNNSQLPPELIFDIFELGAHQHTPTALSLLRLSSWSRNLILPVVYDTVVLQSWSRIDQFRRAVVNYGCFGNNGNNKRLHNPLLVKKLYIDVGEYPISDIISSCPSLTSLVIPTYGLLSRNTGPIVCPSSYHSPNHQTQTQTQTQKQITFPPTLTNLTLTGPTYILTPALSHLPPSITHLVLRDDAPMCPASLAVIMGSMPLLTHFGFWLGRCGAEPGRLGEVLEVLLGDGDGDTTTTTTKRLPLQILVIHFSAAEADTRFWPVLKSFAERDGRLCVISSSPPSHHAQPPHQIQNEREEQEEEEEEEPWFTHSEWSTKGGEWRFWERMEGLVHLYDGGDDENGNSNPDGNGIAGRRTRRPRTPALARARARALRI